MGRQTIINFKNCSTAVEDVKDPEGKLVGRSFMVIDNDEDVIYRCNMPLEVCKEQGQALLGLSGITLPEGTNLSAEVAKLEEHRKA